MTNKTNLDGGEIKYYVDVLQRYLIIIIIISAVFNWHNRDSADTVKGTCIIYQRKLWNWSGISLETISKYPVRGIYDKAGAGMIL